MAYVITAIISCVLGVLVGQFDVHYIIDVALPALMFIYPLTIVLILLNILPQHYASKRVFRWVVMITFLFSIPDFLNFLIPPESLESIRATIPLANQNLGWVIPAILTFILVNVIDAVGRKS